MLPSEHLYFGLEAPNRHPGVSFYIFPLPALMNNNTCGCKFPHSWWLQGEPGSPGQIILKRIKIDDGIGDLVTSGETVCPRWISRKRRACALHWIISVALSFEVMWRKNPCGLSFLRLHANLNFFSYSNASISLLQQIEQR